MENTFSIRGAFKDASAIMKDRSWKIIKQFALISFVMQLLFIVLFSQATVAVTFLVMFAQVKWALAYVKKGSFSYDDLFEGVTFKGFVYFICAIALAGLFAIGGLILLIIPGIIIMLALYFVHVIVIDRGLSPRMAIKESARITKGNRWKLFLFLLTTVLVNILGFVCLFVGIFYTLPLTHLATISIYKKLSAEPVSA